MNSDEVWARLTGVFREVFDDDEIVIAPATTARDVDGWNSLANIRLMISIEVELLVSPS